MFARKLQPEDHPAAAALTQHLIADKPLRAEAAKIVDKILVCERIVDAVPPLKTKLNGLREQRRTAFASERVEGTVDHNRESRDRAIADTEAELRRQETAAYSADEEARLWREKLAGVNAKLRQLDAQLPRLQHAALLEQLADAAPALKAAQDAYMVEFRRVFTLTYAADSFIAKGTQLTPAGSGLDRHLVLPHPSLPEFKALDLPRGLHLQLQAEATKLVEELRR
jgi:hypothetical protein